MSEISRLREEAGRARAADEATWRGMRREIAQHGAKVSPPVPAEFAWPLFANGLRYELRKLVAYEQLRQAVAGAVKDRTERTGNDG